MPVKRRPGPAPKVAPEEAHDQLLAKIRELANLYKELHPEGDRLQVSISLRNNLISFNNEYWEKNNPDCEFEISYNWDAINPDKEIYPDEEE